MKRLFIQLTHSIAIVEMKSKATFHFSSYFLITENYKSKKKIPKKIMFQNLFQQILPLSFSIVQFTMYHAFKTKRKKDILILSQLSFRNLAIKFKRNFIVMHEI